MVSTKLLHTCTMHLANFACSFPLRNPALLTAPTGFCGVTLPTGVCSGTCSVPHSSLQEQLLLSIPVYPEGVLGAGTGHLLAHILVLHRTLLFSPSYSSQLCSSCCHLCSTPQECHRDLGECSQGVPWHGQSDPACHATGGRSLHLHNSMAASGPSWHDPLAVWPGCPF